MDNRINHNKINNIKFNGVKPNNLNTGLTKGVEKMEELVKKMISDLKENAKENVKSKGEFDIVWEEFENPDKSLNATHFLLKISVPKVKGAEDKRYLEAAAVRRGSPYGAESVICLGSKQEILDKLNEQGIEQIIKEKFINLAKGLEDI